LNSIHSSVERSLITGVALHTRVVPSLEFGNIDNSIAIKIQIPESLGNLIIIERLSKFGTHLSEFTSIDLTRTVFIELVKSGLDLGLVVLSLDVS
jgi:hypothetical protein